MEQQQQLMTVQGNGEMVRQVEQPQLLSLPPEQLIHEASRIATVLDDVLKKQQLFTIIQGKKHIRAEGWSTLGSLLGITPREVEVTEQTDGSYIAVIELFNWKTNQIVGRASALCGIEEKRWAKADRFSRRSMAITRATGKAFSQCFKWIVTLAGYSPTPLEEMPTQPQNYQRNEQYQSRQNYQPQSKTISHDGPPPPVKQTPSEPPPKPQLEIYKATTEQQNRVQLILEKKNVDKNHWLIIDELLKDKPMGIKVIEGVIETVLKNPEEKGIVEQAEQEM